MTRESFSKFLQYGAYDQGRLRQRGQAMIEYLLVVIVSVLIVGAMVEKMWKPFDDFVRAMMGTYVQCLLETGELPTFGAANANAECKPYKWGDKSAELKEKEKKEDKDDADKAPQGPSSKPGVSVGRVADSRKAFNIGPSTQATQGVDGGIKVQNDAAGSSKNEGAFFSASSGGGRRQRAVAITGEVAEAVIKKEAKKQEAKTSTPVADNGGYAGGSKKVALKPPPKREKIEEIEVSQSWDVSQIVKIVIVAAIIILIFVLLGGQILQVSKNWEK